METVKFNKQEQITSFREKQIELSGMLKEASDVISTLNMTQFKENLSSLSAKVHDDTFKIQVVGTFKNGKSTFINSLLGEEVLPAYSTPCTAVINEVKYGKEKRAILHFRNPLPEHLLNDIPEKAMAHMKKHHMKNIPPIEIGYNEIEDYVVIPIGKDPKEALKESPYDKVELFWPLELLKNGVEIIDSPGLNENGIRTKVTMEYLSKADAIIFVLSAEAICSADEMKFIKNNLKNQGFEDPFFVVNRFDLVAIRERNEARKEKERNMIRQYAHNKLDEYTTNDIFFVSALDALDGKLENDAELIKRSGMPAFEAALSKYLVSEKGKAKLVQPSKELKRILSYEAKDKIIPMQRKMLSEQLDDVKKRYENVKPQIVNLNAEKNQLKAQLELKIERSKPEIKRAVTKNFVNLNDSIATWVNEYEHEAQLGIFNKEKAEAVTNEILGYINDKVEENQLQWKQEILCPLIEEKSAYVFEQSEADLVKIHNEIDRVNIEMSGGEYKTNDVPTWKRVAGVVGGLAVGDVLLVISGGVNGIGKTFAKTLAFEAGAVLLSALGLLNPITLIAIIISAIVFNVNQQKSSAMRTLKENIIKDYTEQLAELSQTMPDEIFNDIIEKFNDVAAQIIKSLDIEIEETENQIKAIIAELEKGEKNVSDREKVISETEVKINDISKRLDNLIFRLVEG